MGCSVCRKRKAPHKACSPEVLGGDDSIVDSPGDLCQGHPPDIFLVVTNSAYHVTQLAAPKSRRGLLGWGSYSAGGWLVGALPKSIVRGV